MKPLFLAVLGIVGTSSAALAKDEPQVLKRTGQWELNYDRDACHLLAQFGAGDAKMLLRFSRYGLGDSFDLTVFGNQVRYDHAPRTIALDFGIAAKPETTRWSVGTIGTNAVLYFTSQRLDAYSRRAKDGAKAPPILPAQEAAVTGATISASGKPPFRLEFGSLAKPMAQLRACQDDLLRSWGYDPAVQATLTREAEPIAPGNWLTSEDYPEAALEKGQSGTVQFRLDVDPDGKMAGCYVVGRSSPDAFADATCKAVSSRARFRPALDANGRPVRTYYVHKVIWSAFQ